MRLKTPKTQNRNANNLALINEDNRSNDLLNGSSTSSSCASAGPDDLDLDSADDEIDVGTNADSIGYNTNLNSESNQNGTSSSQQALNGINNDHHFGTSNQNGFSLSSSERSSNAQSMSEADRKRAHHNALERKRRDHIKDSFHTLRDAIPNIKGEKTSRAQILKAATDYIKLMRNRNSDFQTDIDTLKKQNFEIENQIRQLEKAKLNTSAYPKAQPLDDYHHTEDLKDFKFDLSEPPTPSASNVLIINKPSGLSTATITTTSLSNSKKLKTIINTKNSLNIINLNTSTTNANTTTTSNLKQNDNSDFL